MYLKIFKLLILIIALSCTCLSAQQITNSPYSRYGIGDVSYTGYGHHKAMGGAAVAESSPFFINLSNPAANSDIPQHRFIFDAGFDVKYTETESSAAKQKNNNTTFSYFAGGFSAKPWWGMVFGVMPVSAVGYSVIDSSRVYVNGDPENENRKYTRTCQGNGGLSKVFLSASFKFLKMFSAGVRGEYIFGDIERTNYMATITSGYKSNSYYNNNYIIRGFNYGFGLHAQKSVMSKTDSSLTAVKIAAGITFSGDRDFNARNEVFLSAYNSLTAAEDTIVNDTLSDGKLKLPGSFAVGLSAEFFDQLTVNIDYKHQDWGKFLLKGEDAVSSLGKNKYIGFGLQYVNAKYSSRFYKKINYRFGMHRSDTYIKVNGYGIEDKGITFGLGIPLNSLMFNIGCDLGVRGTTEHNLYKEKYFLLHFSVSVYDVWFVKRKFQ